jgi:dolichyl-phosphate beta-glucosyltransferase
VSTSSPNFMSSNQIPPRLSLVIPAYNEGGRLDATLAETNAFLNALPFTTELIVADDGSTDDTRGIAESYASRYSSIRVVSIRHAGKAAALRAGMTAANGDLIAFTDADLATPLAYLRDFVTLAEAGADIVAGSREGANASRIGEPWYRHVMGRVFNRVVQILLIPGIDDTQCGFKLFKRRVIRDLLASARLYLNDKEIAGARVTAFDVELLAIARLRGYRIEMVPVVWTYGDQSKVNPSRDSIHNLRDVLNVYVNAKLGRYGRLDRKH